MISFANSVSKQAKLFNASLLPKDYSIDSENISGIGIDGFFTLQWEITGDGTVTLTPYCSVNGADFIAYSRTIATGQTKTTGPGANGKNMTSFRIDLCSLFFIRATETAKSNPVYITAWLKAK
jgi:hypothetical protein